MEAERSGVESLLGKCDAMQAFSGSGALARTTFPKMEWAHMSIPWIDKLVRPANQEL